MLNENTSDSICPACNAVPGEAHTTMTEGGLPCNPKNRDAKRAALQAQLDALGK